MSRKRELYEELKKRDGLVCGICGKSLVEEWEKYQVWLSNGRSKRIKRKACEITIDHIFPKSKIRKMPEFKYKRGWWYADISNLQLSHWSCNNKKGDEILPTA